MPKVLMHSNYMLKPIRLSAEYNGIVTKITSTCGNGCHSWKISSSEVTSKVTLRDLAFIRQPSVNFAINAKLVMASQMSGGCMTLAKTFLRFLGLKGRLKMFYKLEQIVGDSQRTTFEVGTEKVLEEKIELTIKNDFNGNRPNVTIPLTILYGKLLIIFLMIH